MADELTLADRRLLLAVRDGLVSYSPGARGGHLWQRYDREAGAYKTVSGSRMQGFILRGYTEKPRMRASGLARITDVGRALLDEQEGN